MNRIATIMERAIAGDCEAEAMEMLRRDVKLETVEAMTDLLGRAKVADCRADVTKMRKQGDTLQDIERAVEAFEYLGTGETAKDARAELRDGLRARNTTIHGITEHVRTKYDAGGGLSRVYLRAGSLR